MDHLNAGKSRYWDLLRNDFHSQWETTCHPTGIYLAENPHLGKMMEWQGDIYGPILLYNKHSNFLSY